MKVLDWEWRAWKQQDIWLFEILMLLYLNSQTIKLSWSLLPHWHLQSSLKLLNQPTFKRQVIFAAGEDVFPMRFKTLLMDMTLLNMHSMDAVEI
jgi:hypothetical protein